MEIIGVKQGSPEWMKLRKTMLTASEASVMMGRSKHMSRSELLRLKATGSEKEFSQWVQENLLDKGHAIEASARSFAERAVDSELLPLVGASSEHPELLASFDGISLLFDVVWECKSWNQDKADCVAQGRVPEEDYWQVVQQLVVSGAEQCLYMVTDGTEEGSVWAWKALEKGDKEALMEGWAQFKKDLEAWKPVDDAVTLPRVAQDGMPVLVVDVQATVKSSNIESFKALAIERINGINTDLVTDQHFADAEESVKWCQNAERALEMARDRVLSQTADLSVIVETIAQLSKSVRDKRLAMERLIKTRKQSIRDAIAAQAMKEFLSIKQGIESTIGARIRTTFDPDAAMKGKKTRKSCEEAVADALAEAKRLMAIENALLSKNLALVNGLIKGYEFLFNDIGKIIDNESQEAIEAICASRINEYSERIRLEKEKEANKAPAAAVENKGVNAVDRVDNSPRKEPELIETVTIALSEFEELKDDSAFLQVLMDVGVRDWPGWDYAVSLHEGKF